MAYFQSIFATIDFIGTQKFENDVITLEEIGDNTHFFWLLQNLSISSITKETFGFIKADVPFIGRAGGTVFHPLSGMIIRKKDHNSICDQVSPEFLQSLKKATRAFLEVLASHWEISKTHQNRIVSLFIDRQFLDMKNGVLKKIIKINGIDYRKVDLRYGANGDPEISVEGKLEDLQNFSDILRLESLCGEEISLKQKVSRFICKNFNTFENQIKSLPEPCKKKILEEMKFCIKNFVSNEEAT